MSYFFPPENVNARENVKCLMSLAKIIKSVTRKVGANLKLDYVLAKNLINVFMVLYANAIRIVANHLGNLGEGVILNLDVFVEKNLT